MRIYKAVISWKDRRLGPTHEDIRVEATNLHTAAYRALRKFRATHDRKTLRDASRCVDVSLVYVAQVEKKPKEKQAKKSLSEMNQQLNRWMAKQLPYVTQKPARAK
jgi:chromatin segregation and condensation protein Rec8/ScpA/Scc1 (kleisin family)